ncbi:MAG TPA: hypothetical protein VE775_07765 [Pyrinomonadaceae bacterium]|nr:hypothetical protein [Pyrinomonadaceae bacterium]
MAFTRDEALARAQADLAERLGLKESEVAVDSVEDTDFPDANFGASMPDEMSAQMITPGWRIRLKAAGQSYEYRANRNRLRLFNYKGTHHRVV